MILEDFRQLPMLSCSPIFSRNMWPRLHWGQHNSMIQQSAHSSRPCRYPEVILRNNESQQIRPQKGRWLPCFSGHTSENPHSTMLSNWHRNKRSWKRESGLLKSISNASLSWQSAAVKPGKKIRIHTSKEKIFTFYIITRIKQHLFLRLFFKVAGENKSWSK